MGRFVVEYILLSAQRLAALHTRGQRRYNGSGPPCSKLPLRCRVFRLKTVNAIIA